MDTNTKSDVLVKVLLAIISILLFVLVLAQIPVLIQVLQPKELSEECILARTQAKGVVALDLNFLENYKEDVYGNDVKNINQQMFRVGEYQYLALEKLVLEQNALLKVMTECQW